MAGPVNEWVIHDNESLRKALNAMKSKRKLTLEDLFHKIGARLLNRFLRGDQENLYIASVFKACDAMEFEIVIREPQRTKTQKRLDALRAEREMAQKSMLREAVEEQVTQVDRDEQGKLTRPLTKDEVAQVNELLERYSNL